MFKELAETLLSLTFLVFILAAMRKAIMFLAGLWNITGVVSFLS